MRKLTVMLMLFALMISAAVPVFAQDGQNLVERAQSATGFDTLLAAATEAGLADTLANDGPFTVFAPTNGAFEEALAALGITAEDLLADTETLTSILLYHVVDGEVFAADVVAAIEAGDGVAEVETLNGATISVTLEDGVPYINGSVSVFATDISASNGVIHAIDGVLLPPADEMMAEEEMMEEEVGTIVDVAVSNEDFSILVDAVVAAELAEVLSGEGPFTVFAPTNDAFVAALEALGLTAEELLADTETLTTILTYHVVAGEFYAEDVLALDLPAEVETVQGEAITISLDEEEESVMVNNATVVATDVMASNGVIHVIDTVILPPSVIEALGLGGEEMAEEEMMEEEVGTIVDVAVANEDFSILVDAVVAAELADVLSGEGPFTVFAPTNDAFVAALEALGLTAEELLADTETLTTVLTYHVVAGEFYAEDVLALDLPAEVETVQGEAITISASDEGVMVNNANVAMPDVMASNGVIHVIDAVILPPSVVEALGLGE